MPWGGIFDINGKLKAIKDEEAQSHAPDFWNNPKKAELVLKGINQKKKWTQPFLMLSTSLEDLSVLFDFYKEGDVTEVEVD